MSGPISPKVLFSALAGIFFSSILANITFVTPSMLTALGVWAPFVYGTAVAILTGLVGYFVKDPLRQEALDKRVAEQAALPAASAPAPHDPTPAQALLEAQVAAVPTPETLTAPAPAAPPAPTPPAIVQPGPAAP